MDFINTFIVLQALFYIYVSCDFYNILTLWVFLVVLIYLNKVVELMNDARSWPVNHSLGEG